MNRVRTLAPLLPYAATLIGIHLLSNAWAAILFYHSGVVAVMLAGRRRPVAPPGRGTVADAALIVVCATSGLALYVLWPSAKLGGLDLDGALAGLGLSGVSWWVFAAYFVAVHPILEEFFWRGFLRADARHPILNDALFGGYHAIVLMLFLKWYLVVIVCLAITTAAWQWRQRVSAAGGTRWVIAAHTAADLGVIVATALLLRPDGL